MLTIDGSQGEGGGQILRTALALSAVTGQPFQIVKIRARRAVPGLRPQHLAAVRAATLVTDAHAGGAFEGSPDLRFEPKTISAGDYRFEIATAGAADPRPADRPRAPRHRGRGQPCRGHRRHPREGGAELRVPGPQLGGHGGAAWGSRRGSELARAGFYPPGGGEVRASVSPWTRPAGLSLETRGALLEIRGVSGAGKVRGDVAQRQADATRARLWEARRLESSWEVADVPAASPGTFLYVEAIFEQSRAAFGFLGEKGLRAEALGDRAARTLLRFLEGDAATDPHLADQLAVPLAIGGGGGRITTSEVTPHLVTVAEVVSLFGIPARTWGRVGGPGGIEVAAR